MIYIGRQRRPCGHFRQFYTRILQGGLLIAVQQKRIGCYTNSCRNHGDLTAVTEK